MRITFSAIFLLSLVQTGGFNFFFACLFLFFDVLFVCWFGLGFCLFVVFLLLMSTNL